MPRKIRVTTVCQGGMFGKTVEEGVEKVMALLDLACRQKPDIVCLPENFATAGLPLSLEEKAQPVPGPISDACAKRAREHRTYVICPMQTKRDGSIYNSAVVIDRGGQIAGIYDKTHPVTSTTDFTKVENGMMPGGEAQVLDLDFGRVGCQICFDIGFPETWHELGEKGAQMVFWPSAYDGGFPLQAYAYLHQYYVVSSVRSLHSRIINPLGQELDHTGRRLQVISRVIDMDYIVCHYDFHTSIPRELQEAYGEGVSIRSLSEEGRFMVETNRDDLPLEKVIEKFGLEANRAYHGRHYPAYEALRVGKQPEPQETPYKDRPQWG